jgi:hypothetical protein
MKANVIEVKPVDMTGTGFEPLIKLATKKKLQNNAYYLRRGIRPERLPRERRSP